MNRFDEFCERHRDRLVKRLERRCGDDAEDIAHEAFLRVWKHLDSIAESPGAEWVYLWITANNIANRWNERARRFDPLDEKTDVRSNVPSAEGELLTQEFNAHFAAAMSEFPALTRKALVRRRHGDSYDEIAADLGTTNQAVRTRVSRACATLAERLGTPPDGVPWSQLLGDNDQ